MQLLGKEVKGVSISMRNCPIQGTCYEFRPDDRKWAEVPVKVFKKEKPFAKFRK